MSSQDLIFKDAPPQRPGLAAKSLDDLWGWCQGKIDAGSRLGAEAKLEGLRCLASKCSDDVRINFKADQDLARQHPELIEAVSKAPFDSLILDGVALAVEEGRDPFFRPSLPAADRRARLSSPAGVLRLPLPG